MDTKRMIHTSGTSLAVAGLLLTGCSTGASVDPPASALFGAGGTAVSSTAPGVQKTLAPLPQATPSGLRRYYEQKLTWRDCGAPGFECATMKVPLDYAKPNPADDVKLAVARKKADGTNRIGSLLVNPGGPGGSAIDYLQYAALGYPAPVRARYDMVAFDPRGVARSQPVKCLTDREMDDYTLTDATPDNQKETDALIAEIKKFSAGCQKHAGKVLAHVSTVEAARDMDVLRALLGDKKLNYVGKSYGTFIGATYAGLFPKRVGRLVLDGALDPSVPSLEASRAQAGGFELAFGAFAEDCVKRTACPLGTSSKEMAGKNLDQLFQQLDRQPLPTHDLTRSLNESLATTGVIAAMYDEGSWAALRDALKQVKAGDGSGLLALSDQYYEREGGHYSNLMYANAAVNCLDMPPAARTPQDVRKALPSFEKSSPHFGAGLAWSTLSCANWPVRPTGEPHRIEAKGAAPILVVGTIRDPATPYAWAKSLARQLDSGVLLTYDGNGHTAYARGSACVDAAINTYLLQGKPPADNKRCR